MKHLIVNFLSLQNLTMQFSCQVALNELLVEDLNASFAAQHGFSIALMNDCKEKLTYWNNYCDSGK